MLPAIEPLTQKKLIVYFVLRDVMCIFAKEVARTIYP